MGVEFSDHAYIAAHEAIGRYAKSLLKRGKPARPEAAMLVQASSEALETLRAACPDHLLEVLGLVRTDDGTVNQADA